MTRLDILLVQCQLASSRTHAKKLVDGGRVLIANGSDWLPAQKAGGQLLSLVKPQFEVGSEGIGKGGLVRDSSLYLEVQEKVSMLCAVLGLTVKAYIESPITGGDGNREFLLWAQKAPGQG